MFTVTAPRWLINSLLFFVYLIDVLAFMQNRLSCHCVLRFCNKHLRFVYHQFRLKLIVVMCVLVVVFVFVCRLLGQRHKQANERDGNVPGRRLARRKSN